MPGTWSQIILGEHTVDVYVPVEDKRSSFGVIYLHSAGGETLRGQIAFTKVFDAVGLTCFCPQGGQSWWTDRVCPAFDRQQSAEAFLLQHVVPFIHKEYALAVPRLGLLGVSMGGQGALRLGFRHPQLFPAVAGISPALEFHQLLYQRTPLDRMYDSKEQCRQDNAAMHLNPTNYPPTIFFCCDPADVFWFRGNDRLHEKMQALGITHTCDLSTSRGSHSWDYFDVMAERAIRTVYEGLVQYARRLL